MLRNAVIVDSYDLLSSYSSEGRVCCVASVSQKRMSLFSIERSAIARTVASSVVIVCLIR